MANPSSSIEFITQIPDFYHLSDKEQVVRIAYYLTEEGKTPFTSNELEMVFTQELKRSAPRISQFLSEESRKRGSTGKFIKSKEKGYELSGPFYAKIKKELEKIPELKQFDDSLANLVAKVPDITEQKLLEEAVRCYQVGSNRAMVILMWIVALYHLEDYTIENHLDDFNAAISRHPDSRVNRLTIRRIDDFTDLKESILIELLRSAGIISKSVRMMLNTRLSERNTAAHPSSVVISSPQAIAFGHDMIANVILKY